MTLKPNYRQQRIEKARRKEQRRQEKFLKRQESAAKRKAAREPTLPDDEPRGS
jgi:hypothetical protein